MSEYVGGTHREQTILFPDTLDGYVAEENPVRFIDAFIGSLDLKTLRFNHSMPDDVGRPSYDPSDLLKLYVYGYLNQVRSSRKLERECHRNIELIWLMKKLAPDARWLVPEMVKNGVYSSFVYLRLIWACMVSKSWQR
jgi:transposase